MVLANWLVLRWAHEDVAYAADHHGSDLHVAWLAIYWISIHSTLTSCRCSAVQLKSKIRKLRHQIACVIFEGVTKWYTEDAQGNKQFALEMDQQGVFQPTALATALRTGEGAELPGCDQLVQC